MDESFKRPGSIPFKWEIQPGIPKPHTHSTTSSPRTTKLSPPPSMSPRSPSPSIFTSPLRPKLGTLPYSTPPSPSQSPAVARSASASPSKQRRGHHVLQSKIHALSHEVAVVSQGCFPVPPIRRRDGKRNIGGGGIEMIFPSPHRSMSTRSSPSFSSPFRKSSWARDEVEVAARWLF